MTFINHDDADIFLFSWRKVKRDLKEICPFECSDNTLPFKSKGIGQLLQNSVEREKGFKLPGEGLQNVFCI